LIFHFEAQRRNLLFFGHRTIPASTMENAMILRKLIATAALPSILLFILVAGFAQAQAPSVAQPVAKPTPAAQPSASADKPADSPAAA
jgi:hypothetical protein